MAISIGDALLKLGIDTGNFDQQWSGISGKMDKAMSQWGKKFKVAGAAMLGTATAIGGASLKMAADFDSAMREVNTMMLLNEDEFSDFSKQVQQLARDMGIDATQAAYALYQAISAGVPKENAIDFLAIASKAAIGGVTETEVAVDGLTTVMNAFKMPMSEAQHVADVMFTTVKGGKTTFEELSASMFQVAPIAASLGVSFEDTMATVATLTKQGVPTSVAMTQIRQSMVALTKPTKEMEELLAAAGYETGEAMLQALGYAGAMQKLTEAAGGNTTWLTKAMGSVEGYNAMLAVTGENAEMAAADIDAMSNAAGAATDAFDEMEKSTARQFEKLKSQFMDIAITVGNALMPALQAIFKAITPIITQVGEWMSKNPMLTASLLAIVGALGGFLLLLPTLVSLMPIVGAAFTLLTGPIGLVIVAIAGAIAIGVALWKNWDKIKEMAAKIWGNITSFFSKVWDNITGIFKNHWDKILAILFPAVGIPILIARHWDQVVDFFKHFGERIKDIFVKFKDIMLEPFRAAARGIESAINWIIRQINKISFDVPDWVPFIGGKHFGFNIPEISLPKFGKGGLISEPTLLYGLRSLKPYAIAGEKGTEVVSPAGAGITNNFNISQLVVREESDVQRIARELFRLQQQRGYAGV